MNVDLFVVGERDTFLGNLAAELTEAAYQVALRHGVGEQWLHLKLDLWEALTQAIEEFSCLSQRNRASEDSSSREVFQVTATEDRMKHPPGREIDCGGRDNERVRGEGALAQL